VRRCWGPGARAEGVQTIIGEVLADNAPMLAFVQHLGFTLDHLPEDFDIIEARLSLA
jgi:acetyltransferase